MLCEALEVLGDRYAIYGFSGITRKRCEIFRIKRFDEPYAEAVKSRVSGIQPQDYTRMGAAIRHLTTLLNQVEARTKLLITLSDGKPDDYSDNYRGEYGIEDPEKDPYRTVSLSLKDAKRRLNGTGVILRPWLQDFTLKVPYTPAEVRHQIEAAEDLGVDQWLLWNARNRYTEDALKPAPGAKLPPPDADDSLVNR